MSNFTLVDLTPAVCDSEFISNLVKEQYNNAFSKGKIYMVMLIITVLYNFIIFQLWKHKKISSDKFIDLWLNSAIAQGVIAGSFIGFLYWLGF